MIMAGGLLGAALIGGGLSLFGGNSNKKLLKQQQRQYQQQQAAIKQGNDRIRAAFAGYDQDFYDGVYRKFLAVQRPQIDRQYQDASRQDLFHFARSGNLNGSADFNQQGQRAGQLGQALAQSASDASNYSQQLSTSINQVQNNLLGQNAITAGKGLNAAQIQQQAGQFANMNHNQNVQNGLFAPLAAGVNMYQGHQQNQYQDTYRRYQQAYPNMVTGQSVRYF